LEISGHPYNIWNDKKIQKELRDIKFKIVGDMKGVLTLSGEESELDKVRKIFGIKKFADGGSGGVKGTYSGKIVNAEIGEVMVGKISGYRGNGEPVYDVHSFGSLRKDIREKKRRIK
jgi:hypothetical protein